MLIRSALISKSSTSHVFVSKNSILLERIAPANFLLKQLIDERRAAAISAIRHCREVVAIKFLLRVSFVVL